MESRLGQLGPGRHELRGEGIAPFLSDVLGRVDLQVLFVASDALPVVRRGVAYGFERTLQVVAELPFEIDVALRVASFERLDAVAMGMLDSGWFQQVVENETGLVAKKAIEDAAWGLSGRELASFGASERVTAVIEKMKEWWDRYALEATKLDLCIGARGALAHALASEGEGEPAEIGFGKRVAELQEDGRWRSGVISDIEGKRVQVNWDDGGVGWVGGARLRKPPASSEGGVSATAPVAAPVSAPVPGPVWQRALAYCADGCWRPAMVLATPSGWYDVAWEHGERAWLPPSHVRP